MPIRFVCDSTADLGDEYIKQHSVTTVPLRVIFGEEELRDHYDIQPADFYERMKSDVAPRTSQPTPTDFETVFREATDDGSTVICTTISSDLSGTWSSATTARQELADRDIRIIDTRTVSVCHNAIVQAAVSLGEAGADPDRIVETIEELMKHQRLVFAVDTLEYLRRGGRIGGASAMLGSLLSIKPVLQVKDGKVDALDKVRTFSRAIDRLLSELEAAKQEWGSAEAMVAHAANPDLAAELADRASQITGSEVPVIWVGPVLGCHGGPGAMGLGFNQPLASPN